MLFGVTFLLYMVIMVSHTGPDIRGRLQKREEREREFTAATEGQK